MRRPGTTPTERARQIDTTRTAVYLLNSEYDWSAPPAARQALAAEIEGAQHTVMTRLGHFPMCENPERFKSFILPILEDAAARPA